MYLYILTGRLTAGGKVDNLRRENTFRLMMSLNRLIESQEGYNFTSADFKEWVREDGFEITSFIPLTGPTRAAIAYK